MIANIATKSDYTCWLHYILIALKLAYNINELLNFAQDMLKFDFPEKGLGIVSPPYLAYDISTKMFLMLCSIN